MTNIQRNNFTIIHYCCILPFLAIFLTSCTSFTDSVKTGWHEISKSPEQTNITKKQPSTRTLEIQQLLTNAGYNPGPVDGVSGPQTVKALKDFQSDYRIALTGKPDEETCALLSAFAE